MRGKGGGKRRGKRARSGMIRGALIGTLTSLRLPVSSPPGPKETRPLGHLSWPVGSRCNSAQSCVHEK